MAEHQVRPGDVLGGKFRIERVLGEGGMGVVVQATHLQLEQRVALKFLLPSALHHPETVQRFAREARAAVKIKSEHVARVIDVGALDNGAPYMVMEYLEGRDLSKYKLEVGRVLPRDATAFLLQACEALAEAHSLGIVHRDLKPANLFLTAYADGSPCVKILDFGISKLVSSGSGGDFNMTSTTTVMGSPFYMSPEQMRSTRSVDARTDIWALGVILYELVSGRVPFDADTMPQLCGMVLQDPPPPLDRGSGGLPPGLELVIRKCLEKDPNLRYQNVAELAQALAPFAPFDAQRSVDRAVRLSGTSGLGARGEVSGSAAVSNDHMTQTDFGGTQRRSGASRTLIVAGVVAAFAVAAIAGAVLLSGSEGDRLAEPADSGLAVESVSASPAPADQDPSTQVVAPTPSAAAVAPVKQTEPATSTSATATTRRPSAERAPPKPTTEPSAATLKTAKPAPAPATTPSPAPRPAASSLLNDRL